MENQPQPSAPKPGTRTIIVLAAVTVGFGALAILLCADLWGHPPARQQIPLVDQSFLDTTPWRQTYADLVKAKEDLSDFDCYACHDKGKPPNLRFDANHRLILPDEHSNIVMGHGSHERNNHCFNCHNEKDRETFHIRDGRDLPFAESSTLCGSCHGPTYRDWEAGAHGRTNGYWDRSKGEAQRLACTNCHDPHAPRIPSRAPAPAPRYLRDAGHPAPVKSAPTP